MAATPTNTTTGISDPEVTRRRRAVYSALQPLLDNETLAAALWIWERGYAEGGRFQLSDYVHEICSAEELKFLERDIHRRLVQHMGMPSDKLAPDPLPLMRASPSSGKGRDTGTIVFNGILSYLFDRMDEMAPSHCARVRDLLVQRLSHSPLNPAALSELSGWLASGQPMSNLCLSTEAMRQILYLTCVDIAEHFGPAIADQLFAEAGRAVRSLPEARDFPVHELL
jgi:hypothetical protein